MEKAKLLTKFICGLGKDAKDALYKDHHDYLKKYEAINELKRINKKSVKDRTPGEEKALFEYFDKVPFMQNLTIDREERRELCNLFKFEIY